MSRAAWEAYLWPDPHELVLRNKPGVKEQDQLDRLERHFVARRSAEIIMGKAPVARTFDGDHVRAIHRHLFQDLYEWAGEHRRVNMAKGGKQFVGHLWIPEGLAAVAEHVRGQDWEVLDRDGMVRELAVAGTRLNATHPFREGNGRTTRLFLMHIAEQTGHELDFSRVNTVSWNLHSAASVPRYGEGDRDLKPEQLAVVIDQCLVHTREAERADGRTAAERALAGLSPAKYIPPPTCPTAASLQPAGGPVRSRGAGR